MSDSTDIIVPDIGDFSDVEVIEVLVSAGDKVAREDGLVTLETDKATMDVPAATDGVIESLSVKVGDRVSSGDKIGRMKTEAATSDNDTSSASTAPEATDAGNDVAADAGNNDESVAGGEQSVLVPDIGDFSDVEVIEVLVSPGDEIKVDDSLVTLETDKATMDVPSTVAGTVKSVSIAVGDKVSEGTVVAVVDAVASAPAKSKKPEPAQQQKPKSTAAPAVAEAPAAAAPVQSNTPRDLPPIEEAGFSQAHASPSVRKLARELGVNLVQVKGSGEKKRILHEDVKAFVKSVLSGQTSVGGSALPKVPVVDFAKFGEIDSQPLTRIQKISGPRLQASWINLPHVTQHDLADITELEERRQELKGPAKERGISLTPLAFIIKACISALQEFPKVNASLSADGSALVYKKYYHLGFAADTDQGLVVPVIKDADTMDVYELAEQLGALSRAAREGKLKGDQMQGATFTVSSLGGIGGTAFTPIVNAPEVAILGVSRSSMQPVWNGEAFEPRLMLPLSFSYDHRVIDGAYAARFTTFLSKALTDVDAMLEAIP
ncbi:dihydrolipoyllysine-residue acetyltransferase [Woeseia oceani]|uniref:Dihydrolipoamide acetyltransferase component of pyruvate dehydrogenase complex n=1 Tax=Woeseia oceani TaxID=1548547 RepID=A0A193LGR1_9GAMM|nr:dihydrolipoyllysine-residue acetyltransferase [Woeseia oceani]ANO51697.1 dihydrolipoamide acetyltransferase [Woeseia oceani]